MVLGNTEYICNDCQGGTQQNPADVLGDEIVVMDNNMNVVWDWTSSHISTSATRRPLMEKCTIPAGCGGCEPFNHQFTFA